VYFADLGTHRTTGLGISTGKVVSSMRTGEFDPVVSDDHYLYLSGITGLYALAPKAPAPRKVAAATGAKVRRTHRRARRHARARSVPRHARHRRHRH
jgi:hypothetical protein